MASRTKATAPGSDGAAPLRLHASNAIVSRGSYPDGSGATAPATPHHLRIPLYETGDVRAALGLALGYGPYVRDGIGHADLQERVAEDTEHQARLRAILTAGEDGRWRDLVHPGRETCDCLLALGARAPHLDVLTRLVATNVRAALAMGMPTFLEPVLLVGEPGVGKTWLLSRLGEVLGLPFRSYAMSSASLAEGLSGAHPSWRNSGPGLVARTMLTQPVANALFFVDEVDKSHAHSQNSDPFRPFYSLLEPEGARSFTDEFLGFPIDASRALWVLAANDASAIPRAILDRLVVIEVPEMGREERVVVATSVYEEANAARRGFFAPALPRPVLERLADLSPRSARVTVEHAMAISAADGRRVLREDDLRPRRPRERPRIGFR